MYGLLLDHFQQFVVILYNDIASENITVEL